jgi:hypothetical protein
VIHRLFLKVIVFQNEMLSAPMGEHSKEIASCKKHVAAFREDEIALEQG